MKYWILGSFFDPSILSLEISTRYYYQKLLLDFIHFTDFSDLK